MRQAARQGARSYALSACRWAGRARGQPRGPRTRRTASSTGSNMRQSCRLAGLSFTASGVPRRPTRTCRLVPSRPRSVGLGPVSAPPFGRGARRWGAARDQSTRPLPIAQPPPTRDAAVAAPLGGQRVPRAAPAPHEQDAGQRLPIQDPRPSTLRFGPLGRQQRAGGFPKISGSSGVLIPPGHHALPSFERRSKSLLA